MNDIGLMFGGRFDVELLDDHGVLSPCRDASRELCWDFNHKEHRGSEADIRPVDRNNQARRWECDKLPIRGFVSWYDEASHLHVRDVFSSYGR